MVNKKKLPSNVYRVKITLRDSRPPIWRRLLLDPGMTLNKLHQAIQVSFGWTQTHLWEFQSGRERIGVPDEEFADDIQSAKRVKVGHVLDKPGQSLCYTYDMGDDWEHDIKLQEVQPNEPGMKLPLCLEGARACPPEDCGGVGGYEELIEALKDTKHARHNELKKWLDRPFDPEAFDLDETNRTLRTGMMDMGRLGGGGWGI